MLGRAVEGAQTAGRRQSNTGSELNPQLPPVPRRPAAPILGSCPSSRESTPPRAATGQSVSLLIVESGRNRNRSSFRKARPLPVAPDGERSDGTAEPLRGPRGRERVRSGG